jgi:hypothetical protein
MVAGELLRKGFTCLPERDQLTAGPEPHRLVLYPNTEQTERGSSASSPFSTNTNLRAQRKRSVLNECRTGERHYISTVAFIGTSL